MTRFHARLRVTSQDLVVKVRPSRRGIRLDLGDRFVYLAPRVARDMADCIHDALELKEVTND